MINAPTKHISQIIFPVFAISLGSSLLLGGCNSKQTAPAQNKPAQTKKAVAQTQKPNQDNGQVNPYGFVRPKHLRGVYMTAWVAGGKKSRDRILEEVQKSGLNSVVIDVRDGGINYWKMGIPDGKKAHATQLAVSDPASVLKDCKAHGIYPIARIACFRDNFIPKAFPNRAVQNPDGTIWHDGGGFHWLDPYDKKNWDYIKKIVNVAVKDGFPEIQLDYVRFASEGKVGSQVWPNKKTYPDQSAKPADVIQAFAQYIADDLKPLNVPLSADVFGIISSSKSDQGIGQELVKISKPFEAISPMDYPSLFHLGEYNIAYPNAQPYEIVLKSLKDYRRQVPDKDIRPWLQAFNLAVAGKPLVSYGPQQIADEVRAVKDAGYHGFFLWNAANKYDLAALTAAANAIKSAPPKP